MSAEPESLARKVVREIEASSAPAVPVTILSQALVRTVCRGCATSKKLPLSQARRLGFHRRDQEDMEHREGLVVTHGEGCSACAATGAAGLTGVFGFHGPDQLSGSLPSMREEGWRKVVEGVVCCEDLMALPGAHRTMRSLREISVHAGVRPEPTAPQEIDTSPRMPKGPEAPAPDTAAHDTRTTDPRPCSGGDADAFAGLLIAARKGESIDPNILEALVESVRADYRQEVPLHDMLAPTSGFHLARHAVNTALIALRVASCLDHEGKSAEIATLAMLHDAGLVEAGIDPNAELPPILSEEALDPQGARFAPGRILKALGLADDGLVTLIAQVHRMLRLDLPTPEERARTDQRSQVVALASFMDLHYHGLIDPRPADLYEVTSVVMAKHGQRFSPVMFRALLRAVPVFPVGSLVELSSGDMARVVSLNQDNHFRPCVEITSADLAGAPTDGRVVDLARAPFLHIRQRVVGTAPDSGVPS
jgi:hypothetical protein